MKTPPFLTIIGVKQPAPISPESLARALKEIDPIRSYALTPVPLRKDARDTGVLVDVEDAQFTIAPRDSIDRDQLRSAVAGAALNWVSAASALESSKAGIIIAANRPAGDHAAAVKTAYLLTVINAAVLSLVEPSFVYWGTADMLVEPASFSTSAKSMLADNQPPILQWVRFDLFRGDDVAGAMTGGMRSKGLSHFVGHELLLEPIALPPAEIARRAIGYADQLVREGVSDAVEIPGPASDERIKLKMEVVAAGTLLRMQSTIPSVARI